MAERLGKVIYWAACAVAGLLALFAVFSIFNTGGADHLLIATISAIFAVVVWLAGRATLYVLSGR